MAVAVALVGLAVIGFILLDGFEAMVLPRRVTRTFRPARAYYQSAWRAWRAGARALPPGRWRETFLSFFGPLSLLGLIVLWVCALMFGFALLHWALGTLPPAANGPADLGTCLYFSGVTFTTLGYGDVLPATAAGRFLAVAESGAGFGFLAVVIGYLPVVYQAFSRREVTIALLDARAGSPPCAGEVLLRVAGGDGVGAVNGLLAEWERWTAEVLESHLSFPVLSFYRSQHDNQSWLAALAAVLDTCALLLTTAKGADLYQAQLTFAMARHTAVDLALVFRVRPRQPDPDRLPADRLHQLRAALAADGVAVRDGPAADARLTDLRGMYEPFLAALADYFALALPAIWPEKAPVDNWQTSAWMRRAPGFGHLPMPDDGHFD